MKLSTATIITLSSLLSSTLAVPIAALKLTDRESVPWIVTNLDSVCSSTDPTSCTYQFSVDFAGSSSEVAFSTTCTGAVAANAYTPCADPALASIFDLASNLETGPPAPKLQFWHNYRINGTAKTRVGSYSPAADAPRPYSFEFTFTPGLDFGK